MERKTLTRQDISEALYRHVGLSKHESSYMLETVLDQISNALIESKDFIESLKNSRNEFKNKILEKKLIKVGENSYKDPDSNPINVKPFESINI